MQLLEAARPDAARDEEPEERGPEAAAINI